MINWHHNTTPVPGHAVLGKGFDIFGTYSASAAHKRVLFDTTESSRRTWTDVQSGQVYHIPENVDDPVSLGIQEGSVATFDSQSSMSSYFSGRAQLSGKYGGFSGEFDLAFREVRNQVNEYYLGMFHLQSQSYKLSLLDESEQKLADAVLQDPDYQALPEKYDPDDPMNHRLFFRFLEKYGTHYVSEVVLGARMHYYTSINKAYVKDELEFSGHLSLEYKASFLTAGGEAEATWKRVGEEWAKARNVRVHAVGPTSILNTIEPGYNDNFRGVFVQWLARTPFLPQPIDFRLKPVYAIFSGAKAEALRAALEKYSTNIITLVSPHGTAETSNAFVNLNGIPVNPGADGAEHLHLVVLDRVNLEVKLANTYTIAQEHIDPEKNKAYAEAVKDFTDGGYEGNDGVIAIWLFAEVHRTQRYPSKRLYNMLLNCGAGTGLDEWWDTHHASDALPIVSYGLVGVPGGRDLRGVDILYGSNWDAGSMLLDVFLRPEFVSDTFHYTPV